MVNNETAIPTFVTVDELAKRLGRTRAQIKSMARRGRIDFTARTIGGEPLFGPSTLECHAKRIRIDRNTRLS